MTGGTSVSPDGKPKSRPLTTAHLKTIAELSAKYAKQAIDAAIAPLERRLAELEGAGGGGSGRVALHHRNAAGDVIAELWNDGIKVALRTGDATTEAAAGTDLAARLIAQFESMAPHA